MSRHDLPLVAAWLEQEHVRRWWPPYDDIDAHYRPVFEGRDRSDHYLIVLGERPVGMIQTYLVHDHPDWEELVHVGRDVAGVDLLLGEPDVVGRGLGPLVLETFSRDVVFARPATRAVVAGVDVENRRSLRAFEKAGFRPVRDYVEEGRPHRLMRLDRPV
jgi:aminoglycoside 6'-N-acetyltransferase